MRLREIHFETGMPAHMILGLPRFPSTVFRERFWHSTLNHNGEFWLPVSSIIKNKNSEDKFGRYYVIICSMLIVVIYILQSHDCTNKKQKQQ